MKIRIGFKLAAVVLSACMTLAAQQAPTRLNLVVTEGEGAINNIKQRTARETIVQVQDENHKPIAGAAVIFLLPGDGPGGTFAGGAKTAALVTDANGQAVMPRLTPNQLNGPFQIHVTASYQGQQTSIAISQTNGAGGGGGGSNAAHTGISGKTIGIIVAVVAAGAVAGAVVATRGGNSNPASATIPAGPSTPTGTISLGSGGVTIGPPH